MDGNLTPPDAGYVPETQPINALEKISAAYLDGTISSIGFGEGAVDTLGRATNLGVLTLNQLRRKSSDIVHPGSSFTPVATHELADYLRKSGSNIDHTLSDLRRFGDKSIQQVKDWIAYLNFVDKEFPNGIPIGTFQIENGEKKRKHIAYTFQANGEVKAGILPVVGYGTEAELLRHAGKDIPVQPNGPKSDQELFLEQTAGGSFRLNPKEELLEKERLFFRKYYGL